MKLLEEDETGPGFQRVIVSFDDSPTEAMVFNAELLVLPEEIGATRFDSYEQALAHARLLPAYAVLTLLPPPEVESEAGLMVAQPGTGPSTLVWRRLSKTNEQFKRFSAFKRDRRVAKGLLPGTYATSANDAGMAPSGFSAVGRYALPSLWPACQVFTIAPNPPMSIKCGTVSPAFGQAGGGVEVFFPGAGNPPGAPILAPTCITGPKLIPEI